MERQYTDVMIALIEDEFEGIIHDETDNDEIDKINKLPQDILFDDAMDDFRVK
ncbi:TPA: hypothetical protein HA246_02785 [Candidatus Woesearchaeota archaeon]|nr:hypothetical protein [Candidatus Woesearchaeota archaeon]